MSDLTSIPLANRGDGLTISLVGLLVPWLVALASLYAGTQLLGGPEAGQAGGVMLLAMVALAAVGTALCLLRDGSPVAMAGIVVGVVAGLGVIDGTTGWFSFRSFGDTGFLPNLVAAGAPFTRWLAGSVVLAGLYEWLREYEWLPAISASSFVEVAGALWMGLASVALLIWKRGRWEVLLPLTTPIWLLLMTGYDEYYPFIAPALLLSLYLILSPALPGSRWIPVLAGLLPLLYIAYAPLALLLILRYVWEHPRQGVVAALVSATVYFGGISLLWPDGLEGYLEALTGNLNLGEKNTLFARYQGHSASALSPFFSMRYALSAEHLRDLAFMVLLGAGWCIPLLAALCASPAIGALGASLRRRRAPALVVPAVAIGWQLFYLLFMIPKLGPTQDLDLFFSVYLLSAVLAGSLVDKGLPLLPASRQVLARSLILATAVAGNGAILAVLLAYR